jgi:hypothetical protein
MTVFWGRDCGVDLCGAFAVDAEAVGPALDGFNVLEVRVGRVAHLSTANVGEAGGG